jgi:hypothetical protein
MTDPRLVWMAIAAARLTLFERGEIEIEEACEGLFGNWSIDTQYERADVEARKRPVDRRTAELRRLLDSTWSIDAIYRAVNNAAARGRERAAA